MGLDIVSFNVQNFVDDSAVIENPGGQYRQDPENAAISRAVSEKEIAKARAIAQKEANDAEVAAAQEIAEKRRSLPSGRPSCRRPPTPKGRGRRGVPHPEEQQRKSIEITTAEANIAKQEKGDPARGRRAEVMEQSLDARYGKRPKPALLPASRRQTPSCTSASARRRQKNTSRNSRPRL